MSEHPETGSEKRTIIFQTPNRNYKSLMYITDFSERIASAKEKCLRI
jgi:hypothetical protein